MSAETDEKYGAGMPFIDALRLLSQYGPLMAHLQAIASAKTPYDRAVAVVAACKWATAQTRTTQVDDEAVEHLQAVLNSPEGKAFFDWAVKALGG